MSPDGSVDVYVGPDPMPFASLNASRKAVRSFGPDNRTVIIFESLMDRSIVSDEDESAHRKTSWHLAGSRVSARYTIQAEACERIVAPQPARSDSPTPNITRPVSTVTEALMRGFLWKVATNTLLAIVIGAAPTQAQLNTQHVKGAVGSRAGSQPPPHAYVIAPIGYIYNTDEVKDRDGNTLSGQRGSLKTSSFRRRDQRRHDEEDPGRLLRFPGAVPGGRQQPDPGDGDRPESWLPGSPIPSFSRSVSAGTANVPMPSSAIRCSCRPAATPTARATTPDWACGATNSQFGTTVYLNEAKQCTSQPSRPLTSSRRRKTARRKSATR